jgi:sugar lactone lactonase YvrE
LSSPDGLAFDPDGVLHVVEEGARRVSRIAEQERHGDLYRSSTPVLDGLRSPEGIAFDSAGNLYVVEDVRQGRLIRRSPDGETTVLADRLHAPEGVAIVANQDVSSAAGAGSPVVVYVTESNIQSARRPSDLHSGITAFRGDGEGAPVITHTLRLRGPQLGFWSYTGLVAGPDGCLYVANELSGQQLSSRLGRVPKALNEAAQLLTRGSVFAIHPTTGARKRVASDLLVPEGLSFAADGGFPLYVAEENVGNEGRLSRIDVQGRRTSVCEGFFGIEDVVVDVHGDLYVSEDRSGAIIRIAVSETADTVASAPPPGSDGGPRPAIARLRRALGRVVALLQRLKARFP